MNSQVKNKKAIIAVIIALIVLGVLFGLSQTVVKINFVEGTSMESRLQEGDVVFSTIFKGYVRRGDVVIVRHDEQLLEKIKDKKKKWVRVEEGAMLYSLGVNTFKELAKEANAIYHIKKIVLVNTDVLDEYMELYRDEIEEKY